MLLNVNRRDMFSFRYFFAAGWLHQLTSSLLNR